MKADSDPDDAELQTQTGKKLVELSMFLIETSMDNAGGVLYTTIVKV